MPIDRPSLCRTLALAALLAGGWTAASLAAPRAVAPAATWKVLFDGTSLAAFTGYRADAVPEGWRIADGLLVKDKAVGDLVTRESYGDFELELEWRIGKAGNSGVFYRGTLEYDHIYWSGPEYQLLDDDNAADGKSRLTAAGSDYALYPAPAGVVRPFGEWNRTRILARGNHVEHWLNGVKILEYELRSADWSQRVAASKFARYPSYGLAARGVIGIQGDHDGELALRNIRIRALP